MWKSALGTYFFAAKSAPATLKSFLVLPDGTLQPMSEPGATQPMLDPFVRPGRPGSPNAPQIDPEFVPNFRFGQKFTPPPDAEKREFNGRHYYEMPLPIPSPPQSVEPQIKIVPAPQPNVHPQLRVEPLFRLPTPTK